MEKVQMFEAFVAENEKETAREIFDELIDVNGEEIADIDSQEAMTILSRRGIRGGKANKIAKELLKLTSAIGESVVNEAVSKSTKIYQIATPAIQSQLVYDLEELFSVYTGTEYRTIAPDFKDDEGYESVLMFNLSKSDIKKIEDNIADVLIWEYSIKKGKTITESVVNESDAALKKEIKEAKKELKQLQKDYSDIADECKDLRSEIVDIKNDIKTHEQDGEDDMADMAGEQLEEKEEELELRLNDLDQCKMELDEVKDWLKNPIGESVVNESDAALKKEIKEAKKELKQLQKDYAELDDNCGDLRSEIVDLKNDIKDGDDEDMIDMAKEQLEEKEEELELCQNDLDQCKMELGEVKDWLKNPS